MRFRAIVGALMAPALAVSVASAQPAPTGTAAACPDLTNVKFGSPSNSSDKTQVACTDFGGGISVALTAVARFNGLNQNPPPVVETSPGTYLVQAGPGNPAASGFAQWNFNYDIIGTTGGVYQLLIDRDPGLGTTFQTYLLNSADNPNTGLSYGNSENEGFFNIGADVFDPNALGTYTIQIQELDGIGGRVINTASMNVVTSTPEPASIALMATGFVGLAGFVRRRRNTNAA